jgi:hypothetical protein
MQPYYITSENTEDSFGSTDNLEDAIPIAIEWVKSGCAGGPVIIEQGGYAVKRFVPMPDGTVAEEPVGPTVERKIA